MHYHLELWLPRETTDIAAAIETAMEPHHEQDGDVGYPDGWFDWYKRGGRWTGEKDPNYDPEKDIANIETCKLCNGTGFRRDWMGEDARKDNPSYTCNACGRYDAETAQWTHDPHGPGKRVKWPTSWAEFPGDVIPATDCPKELTCHTFMAAGEFWHVENWNGPDGEGFSKNPDFNGNVAEKLAALEITDGFLVTLDYHC